MSESDNGLAAGLDWSLIRQSDRAALNRYLRYGIAPGPFLMAVVCNDLCQAVNHADAERVAGLGSYVQFVLTQMPPGSFGSSEAVAHWIARGGLDGGPPEALLRAILFLLGNVLAWETCAAGAHLVDELL